MHVPYLFCMLFCLRTSKSLSMGDFDTCHVCMDYLGVQHLFLEITMLYFVIYAPISPITLILTCSGFLISDLHISN